MADKAEASPPSPAKPPAPPGGASKVMVGLTGLNSLLLAGVLALIVLRLPAPAAARAAGGEHLAAERAESASPGEHGGAEAQGDSPARGEGSSSSAAAAPKPMLQLPDFVVHLRDPESDRYARLTLNVELRAEKDKEAVSAHMPQLRDAFLAYLSDRTVEELRGSDGMALVKQDLAKKLNELIPSAPVKALYVTELVVQ